MKASRQIELEFYLFAVLSLSCSALFFRCTRHWLPARFGPKHALAGDWRTGENVIQNISTILPLCWVMFLADRCFLPPSRAGLLGRAGTPNSSNIPLPVSHQP